MVQIMASLILTRNTFYRVALTWLINRYFPYREMCLIDLEGCSKLQNLMKVIEAHDFSNKVEIFFFGDSGIYSELFSKFDVISGSCTQKEFINHVSSTRGISIDKFSEHVASCRALKNLTRSQVRACVLMRHKTNYTIAKMLDI